MRSAWALVEHKVRPHAKELLAKLVAFVQEECMPAEAVFHAQIETDPKTRWNSYPSVIEQLKKRARSLGLWNLFLSKAHYPDVGTDLTNLEYALMAEVRATCSLSPCAFFCYVLNPFSLARR